MIATTKVVVRFTSNTALHVKSQDRVGRCCVAACRSLSSSSSRSPFDPPLPPESCDIVKGPSLLRTAVHRPRPTLLHLSGLRSLPFWTQTSEEAPTRVAYQDPSIQQAVNHLEQHWETVLKEYQKVSSTLASDYQADTEHTLHQGKWDWHSYMLKGKLQPTFCQHFPQTTAVLEAFRESGQLFEGTPFGYAFFSTLHPRSRIQPHTSVMNLRLRVHLPLVVPPRMSSAEDTEKAACGIRVGAKSQEWHPGKALVLDDAYEHEVWNDTAETRVLLLVDLWHPDVQMSERRDIVDMFQHAQRQGWWSDKS